MDSKKAVTEILGGADIREVLNKSLVERAGDWDTEAQEVNYDPQDELRYKYEDEVRSWTNDAIVKINMLASAVREVKKVLQSADTYGIDVNNALGYPFKAKIEDLDKSVDYWTRQLHDLVVKGGN